MAIRRTFICFLAAFCIIVEASPALPPQSQFGFVSNLFNQTGINTTSDPRTGDRATVGPSIGEGGVSYDISSSSSSEEESDLDMDIEVDVNDADTTSSFARNWMRVRGNLRPMFPGNTRQRVMFRDQEGDFVGDLHGDFGGDHDKLIGRTSGSSGQGVAIALGVLGLIALVIASAFLIIRKQRNNMETFVPISSLRTPKEGDILLNNMS